MTLEEERELLISYMRLKMEREDWHGVMDVSADLREVDVQIAERKKEGIDKWVVRARQLHE